MSLLLIPPYALLFGSQVAATGGAFDLSWVQPDALFDFDLKNDRGFFDAYVTPSTYLTAVRSGVAWAENTAGLYIAFAENTPRITDKGLLVEESRTNVVLHNRDLTNAAWAKTNITAAKDQAGVDGIANSASSITATAGNGTVLQAITLASSARFQSAFVKRITGSGVVEMTMDNGSTWAAVTVTAGWTRVSIASATLANPTVGFRVVTSGDAIAVDFVQNENGAYATSPIDTTTVAVARSADAVYRDISLSAFTAASMFLQETFLGTDTARLGVQLDGGTTANRVYLYRNTVNAALACSTAGSLVANVLDGSPAIVADTPHKWAGSYEADNFLLVNTADGGTTDLTGGLPAATYTKLRFGSTSDAAGAAANGWIERVTFWLQAQSLAELQALTT